MARGAGIFGLCAGQLRIAPRIHLQRVSQAADRRIRLVARIRLPRVRGCRHDRGSLLPTSRHAAGPLSGAANPAALHYSFRLRLRVAFAADATPLASLRRVLRSRSGRQRNRATGFVARRDNVVSGAARHGARCPDDGRLARRHALAAAHAIPDRYSRLAQRCRNSRWHGAGDWLTARSAGERAWWNRARARTGGPRGIRGHRERRSPLARILGHRDRVVLRLVQPERRHHAPLRHADGSRCLGWRRRAGRFVDGRHRHDRTRDHRLAA